MAVAATIENTMGALYVGIIVSTLLFGVSCTQTWTYYINCRRDSLWIKGLVAAVFVSDACNLGLVCATLYNYVIINFANPVHLNEVVQEIVIQVLFNAITAFLVQTFFAARIWQLSGRRIYVVLPIVVLMFTQLGCNIGYTIFSIQLDYFSQASKGWTGAANISGAAADVSITVILCYLLTRSRTEYAHTNSMIDKLIMFTLSTGLITSICACFVVVFIYVLPNTLVYAGVYFLIGRLYCNSLLATLNARSYIRNGSSSRGHTSYSLDHRPQTFGSTPMTPHTGVSVQIDTVKETAGESRSSFELSQKSRGFDMA